jgi:hypothetical protein
MIVLSAVSESLDTIFLSLLFLQLKIVMQKIVNVNSFSLFMIMFLTK